MTRDNLTYNTREERGHYRGVALDETGNVVLQTKLCPTRRAALSLLRTEAQKRGLV